MAGLAGMAAGNRLARPLPTANNPASLNMGQMVSPNPPIPQARGFNPFQNPTVPPQAPGPGIGPAKPMPIGPAPVVPPGPGVGPGDPRAPQPGLFSQPYDPFRQFLSASYPGRPSTQ
jgi:hypothetical protein